MPINLDKFQQLLNYRFTDPELARQALTHRSSNKLHNERLEFLGDSLLGFIVAELLCDLYPQATEGELSRMRASMVNKESLAQIARALDLGEYVQLGAGELKSGGRQRDSILADAVEAVIAAIYLDGGISPCKQFVQHWSAQKIEAQGSDQKQKDSKTRLQELMQSRALPLPDYSITQVRGEAHDQSFLVECSIDGLASPCSGSGRSKRAAEQDAAQKVLLELGEDS